MGLPAPIHEVRLCPYCIAETETTVAQYQRCVDAGGCTTADEN
jgi:formylglycine-generating enzyme required for sulfatase activity